MGFDPSNFFGPFVRMHITSSKDYQAIIRLENLSDTKEEPEINVQNLAIDLWKFQNRDSNPIINLQKGTVHGLKIEVQELAHHGVVLDSQPKSLAAISLKPMQLRTF